MLAIEAVNRREPCTIQKLLALTKYTTAEYVLFFNSVSDIQTPKPHSTLHAVVPRNTKDVHMEAHET